jgi:hypothetical protein
VCLLRGTDKTHNKVTVIINMWRGGVVGTGGSGFDSRYGPCKFSSDLSVRIQVRSALTEMSTKEFPWG